jgi:membrane protein YqaA with SNARE-associated domain
MSAVIETGRIWLTRENLLRLAALGLVVAVVLIAVFLRDRLTDVGQVGYPVIAFLNFFTSAAMVLPLPFVGVASVCEGGRHLVPGFVALVAASAGTLGELTGYAAGFSGRGVVSRAAYLHRMEGWMRRRGWLVLFLLSFIPNPIFDVAGIAAGALRYPVGAFLPVVWAGKFLRSLALAYVCSFGLDTVLRFFGVGG